MVPWTEKRGVVEAIWHGTWFGGDQWTSTGSYLNHFEIGREMTTFTGSSNGSIICPRMSEGWNPDVLQSFCTWSEWVHKGRKQKWRISNWCEFISYVWIMGGSHFIQIYWWIFGAIRNGIKEESSCKRKS